MLNWIFLKTRVAGSFLLIAFYLPFLSAQSTYSELLDKAKATDNITESIEYYTQAILLNDSLEEAYYERGVLKIILKDYSEAEKDFSQVILINDQNEKAYPQRGIVRDHLDEHYHAMNDFNKAISLNPKFAEAYCSRGSMKNRLESQIPSKAGKKDLKKARRLGWDCGSTFETKIIRKRKAQ